MSEAGRAVPPLPVLIVTGLSGAGKSSALKALEDLGYETIDNLPLPHLAALLGAGEDLHDQGMAIGLDSRSRGFTPAAFLDAVATLRRRADLALRLIFLDCDDVTLGRRFQETRRRHPVARALSIADSIAFERQLIDGIRNQADLVLDTSLLSIHDLRRLIEAHFALADGAAIGVTVQSFSYRRGVPREADLVFDVRFLANPHWDAALRPGTGKDPAVAAYIEQDPAFRPFFERVCDLLLFLLPLYRREGKSYLTIAFGCTGGRHRSIHMTESISEVLRQAGHRVTVFHRDTVIEPVS